MAGDHARVGRVLGSEVEAFDQAARAVDEEHDEQGGDERIGGFDAHVLAPVEDDDGGPAYHQGPVDDRGEDRHVLVEVHSGTLSQAGRAILYVPVAGAAETRARSPTSRYPRLRASLSQLVFDGRARAPGPRPTAPGLSPPPAPGRGRGTPGWPAWRRRGLPPSGGGPAPWRAVTAGPPAPPATTGAAMATTAASPKQWITSPTAGRAAREACRCRAPRRASSSSTASCSSASTWARAGDSVNSDRLDALGGGDVLLGTELPRGGDHLHERRPSHAPRPRRARRGRLRASAATMIDSPSAPSCCQISSVMKGMKGCSTRRVRSSRYHRVCCGAGGGLAAGAQGRLGHLHEPVAELRPEELVHRTGGVGHLVAGAGPRSRPPAWRRSG